MVNPPTIWRGDSVKSMQWNNTEQLTKMGQIFTCYYKTISKIRVKGEVKDTEQQAQYTLIL